MMENERPLTPRMQLVLHAMARLEAAEPDPWKQAWRPNQIARICGFGNGMHGDRHARDGRRMAPAQRINFPLQALTRRGYVHWANHHDGRSGLAYKLTDKGRRAACS